MKMFKFSYLYVFFGISLFSISGCSDVDEISPIESTSITKTGSVSPFSKEEESQIDEKTPLYRYWYLQGGDHFYTSNYDEMQFGAHGWALEKIECEVLPLGDYSGRADVRPVHRLYNSAICDHFYTTSYSEANQATANGYTYEFVDFYIYNIQKPGTIPLYRFYWGAATDHFYTTTMTEGTGIGANLEGILGYVYPYQVIIEQ